MSHTEHTLLPKPVSIRAMPMKLLFLASTMWFLGALFYAYEYYLRVAPSVMLSDLTIAYGLTALQVSNLAQAYYYAYSPMQIPVGLLMDKYGARNMISFACFVCALGAYLFCATGLLSVATLGRFLVGFGSAFAYVGVLKLTTAWFPTNLFALFSGLATTLGMAGAISGDMIMPKLVTALGWEQTVYLSAIAGFILTAVFYFIIRNEPKGYAHPQTPDNLGILEVFRGVGNIFKNPRMWANCLYGFCSYSIISGFAEMWGPSFLKDVKHLSTHEASFANSAVFLGFALGCPVMGFISDKMRNRGIPMALGTILSAICLLLVLYLPYISLTSAVLLLFLAGFFAGSEVIVFATGRDLNPPFMVATAVSATNMAVMCSGYLQGAVGALLDFFSGSSESLTLTGGIPIHNSEDYLKALTFLPILMIIGAAIAFLFLRKVVPHSDDSVQTQAD